MATAAERGATLLLLFSSAAVAFGQLALPSLLPTLVNVTASGTTNLPGPGPVYKREDTLAPFYANLYGIPVPAGVPDPDIYITLEVLNPNMQVGLYCNPGWGSYGDSTRNYPQPGNAVWQADAANGNDTLLISRNDKLYRPPYARSPNTTEYDSYTPYFICAVINTDSKMAAAYRLEADLINNNATLSQAEQTALANIFAACCQADNCIEWKAQNSQNGGLMTDFCSVLGQICTPEGHLLRMDLRGANLQCIFPSADFAAFQWLTTLNLGRNPNLQGNLSDIFAALSGAPNLQNLNLFRDISLTAPLVPDSLETGALCTLAKASLQHLNMESVGAEGVLPACLFDSGSQLVEVQFGKNNLTGTIPDVFAADSPLEVLALSSNQLTGLLPDSLGTLQFLTDLDVTSNNLIGSIPPTLGNVPTLKHVILKFNNLTGSIPSSLATAPFIETLDLKGNQLSTLPPEWVEGYEGSANSSFVNIRFSFNQIEGSFPAGLSDAPQLTFLVINNNTMSGALPEKDGMFPALRALNASHNNFVGTIPAAFGTSGIFVQQPMSFQDGEILEHVFDLSYNQLTGELPAFLDEAKVPNYARRIYLTGNALTINCNAATDFLADVCSGTAAAPADVTSMYPALSTGIAAAPSTSVALPGIQPGAADASGSYSAAYPANTNTPGVFSRSETDVVPLPMADEHRGSNKGKIIGGVVGGLLALGVMGGLIAFLVLRNKGSKTSGSGPSDRQGGLGTSIKTALASAKSNKFERFTEGLEMSDAHGATNGNSRIQGFGSGV